jgi:DNA-binding NtrC family response regulator
LVKFSNNQKNLDQSAVSYLKNYHWPGNVRELENIFKRVCALSTDRTISKDNIIEFTDNFEKKTKEKIKENFDYNVTSYNSLNTFYDVFLDKLFETLDNETNIELHEKIISQVEKQLILKTLNYFSGNQIKSAELLGINRNTLRSKIKKYKLKYNTGKD